MRSVHGVQHVSNYTSAFVCIADHVMCVCASVYACSREYAEGPILPRVPVWVCAVLCREYGIQQRFKMHNTKKGLSLYDLALKSFLVHFKFVHKYGTNTSAHQLRSLIHPYLRLHLLEAQLYRQCRNDNFLCMLPTETIH